MRVISPRPDGPHYLVTGGCGFIGSHVIERLLECGAVVTVVDDLSSAPESNLPRSPRVELIRKDLGQLRAEDLPHPPDAIAHLAAIPSVATSWSEPSASHQANLSNTIKVIELARRWNCRRIVFASSAAVYGEAASVPVSEQQPARPISPYGLQKLCSEDYLELYARRFGLECVALRMFNVYGPRQSAHSEYSGVISRFVRAAAIGADLCITGDGRQTRDFVAVEDVARIFALALRVPMEPGSTVRCNVGCGSGVSIEQVARHVVDNSSPGSRITQIDARPGDIVHSCADITLLRSWLDYQPSVAWQDGVTALLKCERGCWPAAAPIKRSLPAASK